MTADDGPARTNFEPRSTDDDRYVIPLPPRGDDRCHNSGHGWSYTTEIQWVGGQEGDWLRRELAGVLRNLLVWARDDLDSPGAHDEERAA